MSEYTVDGLTYENRAQYEQHQEAQRSTIRRFSDDELRHLAANRYAPPYQRSYAQQLLRERGA